MEFLKKTNYLVFDTETISLERPFIYNIGYVVYSGDGTPLLCRNLVISQIWDDKKLFESAYYASKRPLYVSYMKGRTARKVKWGYACRLMKSDMKKYEVEVAYAYNAPFDQKAFNYTHKYFRNITRPLDFVEVVDILPLARRVLSGNKDYLTFCQLTKATYRNSKGEIAPRFKVENVYPFLMGLDEYTEEHTALQDSRDEGAILKALAGLL